MYTLKVFGKKYQVNGFIFSIFGLLALTAIVLSVAGMYLFGSDYLGSGWYGIVVSLMVYGSFTMNDVRYGILADNKFTEFCTTLICWLSVGYFIFAQLK